MGSRQSWNARRRRVSGKASSPNQVETISWRHRARRNRPPVQTRPRSEEALGGGAFCDFHAFCGIIR
jgi:hypothetical protein